MTDLHKKKIDKDKRKPLLRRQFSSGDLENNNKKRNTFDDKTRKISISETDTERKAAHNLFKGRTKSFRKSMKRKKKGTKSPLRNENITVDDISSRDKIQKGKVGRETENKDQPKDDTQLSLYKKQNNNITRSNLLPSNDTHTISSSLGSPSSSLLDSPSPFNTLHRRTSSESIPTKDKITPNINKEKKSKEKSTRERSKSKSSTTVPKLSLSNNIDSVSREQSSLSLSPRIQPSLNPTITTTTTNLKGSKSGNTSNTIISNKSRGKRKNFSATRPTRVYSSPDTGSPHISPRTNEEKIRSSSASLSTSLTIQSGDNDKHVREVSIVLDNMEEGKKSTLPSPSETSEKLPSVRSKVGSLRTPQHYSKDEIIAAFEDERLPSLEEVKMQGDMKGGKGGNMKGTKGGNYYGGNESERKSSGKGGKGKFRKIEVPRLDQLSALPSPPISPRTTERISQKMEGLFQRRSSADRSPTSTKTKKGSGDRNPTKTKKGSGDRNPTKTKKNSGDRNPTDAKAITSNKNVKKSSPETEGWSQSGTHLVEIAGGEFCLGKVIGQGGFGKVHKALNVRTGKVVAAKRFPTRKIARDRMQEILREAELLKSLRHENIVTFYGYVKNRDYLYFLMEFVEGGSVLRMIKEYGHFTEHLAAEITRQVLTGLTYLHSLGVVHRDIKGSNVLLTKKGHAKLADFGVAAKVNESERRFSVVGTPYWMAPEVVEISGHSTISDVWSVGCLVVEMITGSPPYFDLPSMSALFRIVSDPHPPLPDSISKHLKSFLLKCWQKSVKKRPSAHTLLKHPWLKMYSSSSSPSSSSSEGLTVQDPQHHSTQYDLAQLVKGKPDKKGGELKEVRPVCNMLDEHDELDPLHWVKFQHTKPRGGDIKNVVHDIFEKEEEKEGENNEEEVVSLPSPRIAFSSKDKGNEDVDGKESGEPSLVVNMTLEDRNRLIAELEEGISSISKREVQEEKEEEEEEEEEEENSTEDEDSFWSVSESDTVSISLSAESADAIRTGLSTLPLLGKIEELQAELRSVEHERDDLFKKKVQREALIREILALVQALFEKSLPKAKVKRKLWKLLSQVDLDSFESECEEVGPDDEEISIDLDDNLQVITLSSNKIDTKPKKEKKKKKIKQSL